MPNMFVQKETYKTLELLTDSEGESMSNLVALAVKAFVDDLVRKRGSYPSLDMTRAIVVKATPKPSPRAITREELIAYHAQQIKKIREEPEVGN